jgi:hypothetical protein
MDECGYSATQYGESEECIISFSPKSGDKHPYTQVMKYQKYFQSKLGRI